MSEETLEEYREHKSIMEEAAKRFGLTIPRKAKFYRGKDPQQDLKDITHRIRQIAARKKKLLIEAEEHTLDLKELIKTKNEIEIELTPVTRIKFPKKKDKIDQLSDADYLEMAKDGRLEKMIKEMAEKGTLSSLKED